MDFVESLVFTGMDKCNEKKGQRECQKTELEIGSEIIGISDRFDFKLV